MKDMRLMAVNGPPSDHVPKRRSGRDCDAENCSSPTREQKPYCTEHVYLLPQASEILSDLATRAQQVHEAGRDPETARVDHLAAADILNLLTQCGARTMKRISRDTGISHDAVDAYCVALKREGLVTVGTTPRGGSVVELC